MLKHIGTKKIETNRLLLRKFCESDLESIYENWAKDPENVRYLTWQAHKTIEDTRSVLDFWLFAYDNENTYNWCIVLKGTNQVIGNINVVEAWDKKETCEIGYVLSKKHWGKGLMPEAAKAVINFLIFKVGFNRVQAKYDIENPSSMRVMEKVGMKYEGTLREYCKANSGNWCDAAIYSILKKDFLN